MGNYILFGNCNKKLNLLILYIILTINLTFVPIEIYIRNNRKDPLRLEQNHLYDFFLEYFGYLLCFIPEIFRRKKYNKKENRVKIKNSPQFIEYIFNNPLDEKILSIKEIFILIIICLLSLLKRFLLTFIDIINESEDNEDYNLTEYIMFYLVSIYIFKNHYYKHQYYSIIILVILGIFKYIIKKMYSNNDYLYIEFLFNLINSILTCIIYGYIKGLMEYKYFSVYKCAYIFGIIDIPVIIIVYFIISYIPCENLNDKINQKFCKVYFNEKYYFDNIYSCISHFKLIDFIFSFIHIIGSGVQQVLINKIIDIFTILHISLPFEIHEFIYNIIEKSFIDMKIFVIIIICTIFEFFFFFIFLEIIELNFCGLNYNTKKNITLRGIHEVKTNVSNNSQSSNDDEDTTKNKELELSVEEFIEKNN